MQIIAVDNEPIADLLFLPSITHTLHYQLQQGEDSSPLL